jgi:hypothetical protein
MSSPASQFILPEQFHEADLGGQVALPLNPGHDEGSLRLGEDIGHELQHNDFK